MFRRESVYPEAMSFRELNEWARANPWKWIGLTVPLMFLILFFVGTLVLDRTALLAAAFAAMYALSFALFTAVGNAYRSRRSADVQWRQPRQ